MKELKKKPTSDIRIEALLGFYDDLANKPGRKRDRLYQAVLKMIERGFWNPGDRLPTDADFAHLLPLSVATVQAALKMLSDQKVIVRKQKQGSFVASEDNLNRDICISQVPAPRGRGAARRLISSPSKSLKRCRRGRGPGSSAIMDLC